MSGPGPLACGDLHLSTAGILAETRIVAEPRNQMRLAGMRVLIPQIVESDVIKIYDLNYK